MFQKPPERSAYAGQTLSEYGMVIALVAIACIGALLFMGTSIQGYLASMNASMAPSKPKIAAASALPASNEPVTAVDTAQPPVTQLGGVSSIDLGDLPPTLPNIVDTAGANGSSEALLTSLQNTAQSLLASGQISQTDYLAFTDLANKGYRMAAVEQALQSVALQTTDLKKLASMPVVFEGKTYTFKALNAMIEYNPVLNQFGPLANEFNQQKLSIFKSLSNPAVIKAITPLAENVQSIACSFETNMSNGMEGDYRTAQEMFRNISNPGKLNELYYSGAVSTNPDVSLASLIDNNNSAPAATVSNSNQICVNGSGKLTNGHCQ